MDRPEKDCMSDLPLRQFRKGQRLYFKKAIRSGFHLSCPGQFERIERGMVIIRINPSKGGWTPSWLTKRELEEMCPDNLVKVRPSAVYLWGQGRDSLRSHCWWFRNLDEPVDPAAHVEASIEWMEKLLDSPAVKALESGNEQKR